MKNNILIVGSRSGGHILPGLAIGKELYSQGHAVFFVAENRPLDRALIEHETWLTQRFFIQLQPPAVRRVWRYPQYLWVLAQQIISMLRLLKLHHIDRVVGMGGYSSVPVCCAAWLLRVPYELYELNVELGRAIQLLQHGAQKVVCCFPEALHAVRPAAQKLVPYPLRVAPGTIQCSALTAHGESSCTRFTLFVIGGSQGSQSLGRLVLDWVATLSPQQRTHVHIIHQTGTDEEHIRTQYATLNLSAEVFNYRNSVVSCYLSAHLIISRAGSGALHEIMALQKRAVIVPLESHSTHHQVANAQAVERRNPQQWVMIRQHEVARFHSYLSAQLARVQAKCDVVQQEALPL